MTIVLHPATLHASARPTVTLAEALDWAAITGSALLASPDHYHVATAEGGNCRTPAGPVDLSTVFEARVFDEHRELRWWHDTGGKGRAVVISEDTDRLPAGGDPVDPVPAIDVIDGGYLLWGRTTDTPAPGWVTLATARIGSLQLPAPPPLPGDSPDLHRIRFDVREYVAVEPTHGNAYVAEERLVQLRRVPAVMEVRTT